MAKSLLTLFILCGLAVPVLGQNTFRCGAYVSRQVLNSYGTGYYTRIDSISVSNGIPVFTQKLALGSVLINAMDYHNGYLWGWKQFTADQQSGGGSTQLLKISGNGIESNWSFPLLTQNYNTGAIDKNGIYYNVQSPAAGSNSFIFNRIDLNGSSPQLLSSLPVQLPPNVFWPGEGAGDLIVDKDTAFLYLNQRGLLKINLQTGTSVRHYISANDTARVIGSLFSDVFDSNNIYGYGTDAYTGSGSNPYQMKNVLQINKTTGAVQLIVSSTITTLQADGASCKNISLFPLIIRGNVFSDGDGSTTFNAGEYGIKGPGNNGVDCAACPSIAGLHVALVNSNNIVIQCVPVNQDGSYLLLGVPVNMPGLKLRLSNTMRTPGQVVSNYTPAAGWVETGANNTGSNSLPGLGATGFIIPLPTTPLQGILDHQNFGMEQLPETADHNNNFGPVNTSTTYSLANVPLSGFDAEDDPAGGGISTGATFIIRTLPPANTAVLYYGGQHINTTNFIIANYDPALLKVKFGNDISPLGTAFTYVLQDKAGKADPSPATYKINIPAMDIILPVNGLVLEAKPEGSGILVKWKTDREKNTAYFSLQKSFDGIHFTEIAVQPAANNSNTTKYYQLRDNNAPAKSSYYRIKAVDTDSASVYSNLVRVLVPSDKLVKIYPNPARHSFSINLPAGPVSRWELLNANGRLVMNEPHRQSSGPIQVATRDLPAGQYFIRLYFTSGEIQSHTVFIL